MKLRTVLLQQPLDELWRIAAAADLAPDSNSNKILLVDQLCRRLPEPSGIAARLKAQSDEGRKFVAELAAEGGELLKDEVVRELGQGFVHRIQALLTSLTGAGLVFEDREALGARHVLVGIPDPLLKSIPVPESGRLRAAMKSTSIGLLRAFARELGALPRDTRRPFVEQAVCNHLLHSDSLKSYLNGLPEEKRSILDLTMKVGETTLEEIRRQTGAGDRNLNELLWKTPLFFFPKGNRLRDKTVIRLAVDLRRALQAVAEERGGRLENRPEEGLEAPDPTPPATRNNAPFLLQDLAILLGQIDHKRPHLLKRGGISKSSLREFRRFHRQEDDPAYPEFLMLFAESAGLIRIEHRSWVLAEGAGERLEREAEIRKALFAFWQQTDRWNEWAGDRSAGPAGRSRMEELRSVRLEVLQGLRFCPENQWIAYPRFYQLLLRTSEPVRHLAEHPASGRTLAGSGTSVDELLRRMLRGALAWMGLLELGNPEAFAQPLHRQGEACFRLTAVGLALLGDEKPEAFPGVAPETSTEARFIVQPNFEILSPPDLPYAHYIALCSFSELQSIDVMSHFRITREAFQNALNRGVPARAIRNFFRDHGATELPAVVEALIRECEDKHGEIELSPAAGYLTVVDAVLLDELYAQKRIAACLGPRLSPVSAVLKHGQKPETFVERLHAQGYMPRLAREFETLKGEQHQIPLTSSEGSELAAFLEAALQVISGPTGAPPEEIDVLLRRLRRALRTVSDQRRQEALSRYQKAFEAPFRRPPVDGGIYALLEYPGANPATGPPEIRSLIGYAIDHRLCVEIDYDAERAGGAAPRTVEPLSEDHAMLYAFCRSRKGDRVFRLDRIRSARLTGERFRETDP